MVGNRSIRATPLVSGKDPEADGGAAAVERKRIAAGEIGEGAGVSPGARPTVLAPRPRYATTARGQTRRVIARA